MHIMRVLLFVASVAAAAAASQTPCKDDAVCMRADPAASPGNALLQWRTSSASGDVHASERTGPAGTSRAAFLLQRVCVSAPLHKAHLRAVRRRTAFLSVGARAAPARQPLDSVAQSREVCSGKALGDNCTFAMGHGGAEGKCAPYGMDRFCDAGQFRACKSATAGDACEAHGKSGQCAYATGYPDFDRSSGGEAMVTVNACQVAGPSLAPLGLQQFVVVSGSRWTSLGEGQRCQKDGQDNYKIFSGSSVKTMELCQDIAEKDAECGDFLEYAQEVGLKAYNAPKCWCRKRTATACVPEAETFFSGSTLYRKTEPVHSPAPIAPILGPSPPPNEARPLSAIEVHLKYYQEAGEFVNVSGRGATPSLDTAGGVGATAALDAEGFKAVTAVCCPSEMETFFNRLIDSLGLQVCSKRHMQGLMHWFTCVPDMDFQYVVDVIDNGNPCKYWAPKANACPALSSECQGNWCR